MKSSDIYNFKNPLDDCESQAGLEQWKWQELNFGLDKLVHLFESLLPFLKNGSLSTLL